ncbi:MAG: glycosyl hydrolase 53 family protein, partial [Clostridiales bacterium]|nr:glycosyl hydrolase 53 family protein [Clostridiales bacterium]
MKNRLKQWLSALLAVCLLFSMATPTAFAADADYEIELEITGSRRQRETVTITASFTVDGTKQASIPGGCTLSIWYETEDGMCYLLENSSNDTSVDLYLSADKFGADENCTITAALYDSSGIGLDTDSESFSVAAAEYELSLDISNPTPALGDSVTITADFTVNGHTQVTVPDDCTLSIWYQNDNDWVTPVNGSSTTSTEIYLSADNFTAGNTYTVEAALYDADWNTLASDSISFTVVETTYALSLNISNTAPALGDSVTVTASFTVDGAAQDTIPDGCTLSILCETENGACYLLENSSSDTSADIDLSAGDFGAGKSYFIDATLCDSGGNTLASAIESFTVAGSSTNGTATLSSTTMTESGSITVNFSGTATSDEYYNVQIADSSWSTTYVNEYITSGDSYTIEGYSAGTYQIYIGYWEDGSWVGDALSTTFTVTEDDASTDTYAVTITPSATTCEQNESITFTAVVTKNGEEITLSEQSDVYLWIWADSWADGHSSGLTDCSISPNTGLSNSVTVTFPSVGTYYIAYTLNTGTDEGWIAGSTDVATITVTESTADPSEDITTGDIDDCSFMRGMDLSTFYTNWMNGAVYYDYDGNEYSAAKGNAVGFFQFLYDVCGVNWVRLRVWNNPYDEDGNPYGGGNNDVATAAIIGKWASDAGMTVLIDFHYSDFWADPGRQLAPKAWADMTIDEKVDALYEYTYDSLDYLLNAGVNVGMVQVGNETNGAFCGEAIDWNETFDAETNEAWQNICTLFKSGSSAVREISFAYGMNIKVALHFTNPNNANPSWYAGLLDDARVDYDAMGISYYMYWHGTLDNLQSEIETIANTYDKEVFIAETAYPYTSENFDSLANSVSSYSDFDYNSNLYAISEAGQEAALTAILGTAASSYGCTGLFYWEPAWTALPDTYDEGTGWATKWASDYISYDMDASEGSSFDNQTLFDNNGNALPALSFFADYVEGVENLTEHTYVLDEDASAAATCTANGRNVYVCDDCGSTKIEIIEATGHDYAAVVTAPTCTEGGYTTYTCTVCGDTYTADETEATGHTAGEAVIENEVAATCTTDGSYDEVVYCTVC